MCDRNIVSFFTTEIEPALQGFDALTRLRAISFLAGVTGAIKSRIPNEHNADLETQFMSGRHNKDRDRMWSSFNERFYLASDYFNIGLNSAYRVLYDSVHLPISSISETGIFKLNVDFRSDIQAVPMAKSIELCTRIVRQGILIDSLISYWRTEIIQPPFLNMNDVQREIARTEHIAIGLAYALDLPTSQFDNASNYYDVAHRAEVGTILSYIHENLTLDIDAALAIVKQIWTNRANALLGEYDVTYVLGQVTSPTNTYVPKRVLQEKWLAKLLDVAPLLTRMLLEVRSIQDGDTANTRIAMHGLPNLSTSAAPVLANIITQAE